MFLLTGEPGSGKSQFVASLARDLALEDGEAARCGEGGHGGGSGGGDGGRDSAEPFLPVVFDAREAEGDHGIPLDSLVEHYLSTQLG